MPYKFIPGCRKSPWKRVIAQVEAFMQFDLGLRALHKFLDPRRACYIGVIVDDGPNYGVEIAYTDSEGNETRLRTSARQLAPMSF